MPHTRLPGTGCTSAGSSTGFHGSAVQCVPVIPLGGTCTARCRYQQQLAACSPVRMLNLSALRKDVPLAPLPPSLFSLPAFVGGGDADLVVDLPAVAELAAWFGVEPVVWRGVAHDCMLDTRWEDVAGSMRAWLDGL